MTLKIKHIYERTELQKWSCKKLFFLFFKWTSFRKPNSLFSSSTIMLHSKSGIILTSLCFCQRILSLPPRCSLFFRRTFNPPEGKIQRSCSLWWERVCCFCTQRAQWSAASCQSTLASPWLSTSTPLEKYSTLPFNPSLFDGQTLPDTRHPFPTSIHSHVKPTFCLCKGNILFMRI